MGQKTIKPIIINELSEKKEEVLKLAKKVAKNLVSISFTENSTNSEFATILEESGPPFKSERFIVVIGAGTSHNAIKNIPLGYCASKKLKTYFNLLSKNDLDAQIANCETEYDAKPIDYPKKISGKFCREIYRTGIEKGNEEIAKLFAQDIEELSQVYRLEKTDFETILLAISKYYPREIYDKLKDISNFRYYPDQFHEILAHLFKNRFIDAIINFNFDEILDQSIEDEVGSSEYRKILFDGDVPEFAEIFKDGRLQKPLYIKPHGTISHKTSMRFTRKDYFNISSDIDNFMGELLSGKIPNKDPIIVNLLVFGFKLESFEFNTLLKEHLPESSNIYIFDPYGNTVFTKDVAKELIQKKINIFFIPWINTKARKRAYLIDDILLDLFDRISDCFKQGYEPIGIDRHLCIAELFHDREIKKRDTEGHAIYFRDRTFIEIIMQIAESKGFISLAQLTNDRAGRYYNLYKKYWEKYTEESASKDPKKSFEPAMALHEFCEKLGLNKYAYSREFYTIDKKKGKNKLTVGSTEFEKYKNDILKNKILRLNKRKEISEELFKKIFDIQNNYHEEEEEKNHHVQLSNVLSGLFEAEDSVFCQKGKDIHNNIFKNPKIINTKLAFNYETKKMFEGEELGKWDYFLSIAETGEWLEKKIVNADNSSLNDKSLFVIVADDAYKERLEGQRSIGNNTQIIIQSLPWWVHNQHMSIFMKKDKTVYKVIYFTRKAKSYLITPIILENTSDNKETEDQKIALEVFIAYYLKSKKGLNAETIKIDEKQIKELIHIVEGKGRPELMSELFPNLSCK